MTGGPWTGSMKVVHGPGPKWGSMDPWSMFCPHPGGRAWGGDLIVFVVPGVGHLTDLVLPGKGIFESFFAPRGDI